MTRDLDPRFGARAPGGGAPGGGDPVELVLGRYAALTDVRPAPDLASRIAARIGHERRRTAPAQFLAGLLALDPRGAAAGWRKSLRLAMGRWRGGVLLRAQALALVLLTAFAVTGLAVVGGVAVDRLLRREPAPSPLPSIVLPATPSPTAEATDGPPPTGAPSPSVAPLDGRTPPPTERPTGRLGTDEDPTARPTRTPRPTPRATPRPTREPEREETPRPTRTPRPERTRTPEPEETDEPDGDDHGGGGGSGSGSGGGSGDDDDRHTPTPRPDTDREEPGSPSSVTASAASVPWGLALPGWLLGGMRL